MSKPAFYGEKLLEIRELRGLTIQQVADHLGISKQAVSLYENAKCQPSNDAFQKLLDLLRVPSHFFSQPPIAPHSGPTTYRSMTAATKKMRDVAEQKLKWLRIVVRYLAAHIEFPAADLSDCPYPSDPTRIMGREIEEAADALRARWGLGGGVISNVAHLLENKGIVVGRIHLDSDKLDAFSIMEDGTDRPYVVLASDKESPFRCRLDAAHELGHLVLHRNVPKQLLKDRVVFKEMESQAFHFAGAFLLPARTFGLERVTSSLNSFRDIKKKWKASIGSMIIRASQLGMISEAQKTSLWIERSRRKWGKVEPFDDEFEPERPKLIAESMKLVVAESIVTKEQILADLALPAKDLEDICGLPGFFTHMEDINSAPPIPTLKFPPVGAA
jgi:Zn-dependent peptidase ImmA (M78 family)/transcriptional regulator with XRE-family HTH domain